MKNIFAILLVALFGQTNPGPYSKWSKEELDKANTAKDAKGLTNEEKKVIYLCNMARINPKLFAEIVVKHYLDTAKYTESEKVKSLKKELLAQSPLPPFKFSELMFKIADSHATETGKTGKKGHENFQQRYTEAKNKYYSLGENCFYGDDQALEIVMKLLIDEKIPGETHRKNILSEKYSAIGVAIRMHKTSGWSCVMSLAGGEK